MTSNLTITEAVNSAEAQGRFLSSSELEKLRELLSSDQNRVDIANNITNNASVIVANAARSLFSEQPQLIAPAGNAYTSRRMAAFLNDMQITLRYITYAMVAGDPSILDNSFSSLREMYKSLETPTSSLAIALQKMKTVTLETIAEQKTSANLKAELASYFDKAINSLV